MLAAGGVGAGAMAVAAAPAVAAVMHEPLVQQSGGKLIVSGRVVSAHDGRALAGARIEIWPADARGVRDASTREVAVADGDGRYFARLEGKASRLNYRVSHPGYTASITRLNTGARQRSVTLMRDEHGATRAAFEMKLARRDATARAMPDIAAL
jgi:hypothetical protein